MQPLIASLIFGWVVRDAVTLSTPLSQTEFLEYAALVKLGKPSHLEISPTIKLQLFSSAHKYQNDVECGAYEHSMLKATEADGSEEEDEMDDEAMMKLDKNLSTLFGEQRKKLQAKKDEKERLRREKTLVRDFKIKVLDLVEVFLTKQGNSALVLGMVEPLLSVIESGMSSESGQQEVDFLRRAADIFRNQLCRGKQYCRDVEGREAELHEMLERLIGRAQKLQESSVALYYFSAALYVVKVLRGVMKEADAPAAE
ncbi:hypothetical protein NFI96_030545, partial [Prochilodus magdalenae]